jgi:hypothetical protein
VDDDVHQLAFASDRTAVPVGGILAVHKEDVTQAFRCFCERYFVFQLFNFAAGGGLT